MSKKPRALGLHEPLRHQDHPRPRTRREFVAQSFMTGGATVLMPSIVSLLADPRAAHATSPPLPTDIQSAITACQITAGAGLIPFICFDLSGGGNILGSNVLAGHNGVDPFGLARCAGVDAENAAMGHRTAENLAVQHPRHPHVVDVFCAPRHLGAGFETRNGAADLVHDSASRTARAR